MSISRAFSMYSRYCDVMVAMGMSLMSICCLRIRSNSRSSGPSYCSRWKLSGEDTIFHDSMRVAVDLGWGGKWLIGNGKLEKGLDNRLPWNGPSLASLRSSQV